jgi:ribonuclease HI
MKSAMLDAEIYHPTMSLLEIYTDGSCEPNPGAGAWSAIILLDKDRPTVLSGKKEKTTNNEMELTGILRALEWLHDNGVKEAIIRSDSKYALGCVEWAFGWEMKGWSKKGGPIKNLLVIQQIHDLNRRLNVHWEWVKGHNGHQWNELADRTAEAARSDGQIKHTQTAVQGEVTGKQTTKLNQLMDTETRYLAIAKGLQSDTPITVSMTDSLGNTLGPMAPKEIVKCIEEEPGRWTNWLATLMEDPWWENLLRTGEEAHPTTTPHDKIKPKGFDYCRITQTGAAANGKSPLSAGN